MTMPYRPGNSAHRIRWGLTGLAFAFLIVLLGSVITRASREGTQNAVTQASSNEPSEPLAELGAAPGGSGDTTNNSAAKTK